MNTSQESEPKYICLCDHCGQSIEIVSQWLGTMAACPHCGQSTAMLTEQAKAERARTDRLQAAKLAEKQRRLIICAACEGKVSSQARTCPHCGHPLKDTATSWGVIFTVVFRGSVALVIVSLVLGLIFLMARAALMN